MEKLLVNRQTFDQLTHALKLKDKKDILIKHLKIQLELEDEWEFYFTFNDLTVAEMEQVIYNGYSLKDFMLKLPAQFYFTSKHSRDKTTIYTAVSYGDSVYVAWEYKNSKFSEKLKYETVLKNFNEKIYFITDINGNKLEMEK